VTETTRARTQACNPAAVSCPRAARPLRLACAGGSLADPAEPDRHGHNRAFLIGGEGPPLLLLHGIGNKSQTWGPVLSRLARSYTVIAPDLLGHGLSDKPRGDYSVGGYANGMRDLLSVLDIERVTVIGHSLSGGIAQQLAYQYPERCERLVLVCAGGLGHGLHPALRAATLPGSEIGLSLMSAPPFRLAEDLTVAALARLGGVARLAALSDLVEGYRSVGALRDVQARHAFLRTLRTVADASGQVVTATDRAYLAAEMPLLVAWGSKDTIIPVRHGYRLTELVPGARLEIVEGAGHWPHLYDPDRFCSLVEDFLATTVPAQHDRDGWRALLGQGRGKAALSSSRSADMVESVDLPAPVGA